MNQTPSVTTVLKQLAVFTAIGFVSMVLFGPVVALVSLVLSFAMTLFPLVLLGFLVWTSFQFALHGRDATVEHLSRLGQGLPNAFARVAAKTGNVLRFPFMVIGRAVSAFAQTIRRLGQSAWRVLGWAGPIVGMTLTGALVGGGIGAMTAAKTPDPSSSMMVNAALGGAMAAGVGIALSFLERKPAIQPSSQPG